MTNWRQNRRREGKGLHGLVNRKKIIYVNLYKDHTYDLSETR